MQSPAFNALYAASIHALAPKIPQTHDNVTSILDLLLSNDDFDFGSAAWFLTTQCKPDVRAALQNGTQAGWQYYLTSCVGTTVSDERLKYWNLANQALQKYPV